MKISTLQSIIAGLLILLFCYTAIAKLMDIQEFTRQLNNQILPKWSKPALVWLIPGSELLLSILLAFPLTRMIGLWGSALLMTLFTVYMGLVYAGYFDRVPCNCGGVLQNMGFGVHLIFNTFFLVLSIVGVYMYYRKNKLAVTQNT